MKEITVSHLRARYPRSYCDLLQMLGVRAYNTKSLKLAGIRSVQVFTVKRRRYYCFTVGLEANPYGSVNHNRSQSDKYDDSYVLTIASSGMTEEYIAGSATGSLEIERLEYEVYIKNRKAEFANNTGSGGPASKAMTTLFIYSLGKLIDVDVTSIRVLKEDVAFLAELQAIGFGITGMELGCITVTKNIEEKIERVLLLD